MKWIDRVAISLNFGNNFKTNPRKLGPSNYSLSIAKICVVLMLHIMLLHLYMQLSDQQCWRGRLQAVHWTAELERPLSLQGYRTKGMKFNKMIHRFHACYQYKYKYYFVLLICLPIHQFSQAAAGSSGSWSGSPGEWTNLLGPIDYPSLITDLQAQWTRVQLVS